MTPPEIPRPSGEADGSACPDEDELVAMMEGALSAQALATIEAHVAACEACAEVMGGLGALGEAGRPRTIDRYQLDRRIASGGMGEVWAAWDPKLRRQVAIKLVRPERSDESRERERLLREARALARFSHPNVIAVHDVGIVVATPDPDLPASETTPGEVFIVSELVTGDTLATRGGPKSDWRMLVSLYAQAARGLAAAHAAGLVHRDVKPANLLLGTDGRVRVADFGLAVHAKTAAELESEPEPEAGQSITQRGQIAGTPAYMAPEQRAGHSPEAPADQFALCVAIGEAIVGVRPAMESTQADLVTLMSKHRTMEPQLEALCAVLTQGLSVDPASRFPDMTALGDALDAIVPPLVVETRTPSRGMRSPTRPPARTDGNTLSGRTRAQPSRRADALPEPRPTTPVWRVVALVLVLLALVVGSFVL